MIEEQPSILIHKCCKKEDREGACELTTVTASQISAFFAFLIYISYEIINLLYLDNSATNEEGTIDYFVKFFITLTYVITIIYYFLGCWATEEEMIDELRTITPKRLFYWQWWIRIIILLLLAFFSTLTSALIREFKGFKSNDLVDSQNFALLTYLGTLFICFLIWDGVIYLGNKWELVKGYFWIDLLGLGVVGFGFGYHDWTRFGLAVLILAWVVLVIVIFVKIRTYKLFSVLGRMNKFKFIR